MNNENEIKRMASIIIKHPLESHSSAVELSAQGIGDKKQAVKEFGEKLKSGTHRFGVVDGNNYYVWYDSDIDTLITELYGADE